MITLTTALDHHEYDKMAISIDVSTVEKCPVMTINAGGQQISLTADEIAMLSSVMKSFERSVEAFNQ